jgi:hypothetical protein
MGGVAALISRSFPRGVDRGGRRMLAEMSALGRAGILGWLVAPLVVPSTAYSEGFVWEEAGSIIGNASLTEVEGCPGRFVLANVAVDPAGVGIGEPSWKPRWIWPDRAELPFSCSGGAENHPRFTCTRPRASKR